MGHLEGYGSRFSVVLCAVGAVLLIGCAQHTQSNGEGYSPIGACADGSSPDLQTDPANCGACDVRCDDLRGVAMCQAGVCRLAEPVQCDPGFLDADGNPSNGCECKGSSAADCRTCLDYEVPMNGVDDDCEAATLDLGPQAGGTDVPISRAHCGGQGLSCTLEPGAEDTRCALVACTKSRAASGACGHCSELGDGDTRWCGQCVPVGAMQAFEGPEECFDGVDQDGNGIRDDGPYCEVLLANAMTSECNLASPSAACPPNVVEIPSAGSPLPGLAVGLTYDLAYDRYEVTQAQFAAFLHETGQCELDADGSRPAQCAFVQTAARHPVSDVTWCAAYDYCQWAGKRLPTVTEFYRAAGGDSPGRDGPVDAQGPNQSGDDLCDGDPASVLRVCGADGTQPVDRWAGMAVIGRADGPGLALRRLHHLTGNVAEWLFDTRVDWCATEGPHALPQMREIVCSSAGIAHQRRLLIDWAPSKFDRPDDGEQVLRNRQERMMCGAGWGSAQGPERYDHQQAVNPGARAGHYGFRCARTFHPEPEMANSWPYEQDVISRARATCDPLPRAGAAARQEIGERMLRAVDACLPGLQPAQITALRQRVGDAQLSVFMAVEGLGKVTALRLQAGVDAGWEQLWLADLEPVVALSDRSESCQLGDCRTLQILPPWARDQDAARLVVPEPFDAFTPSRGLVVRSIELGRGSPCLETRGAMTRLEVEADLDELAGLLGLDPEALPPAVAAWIADSGLCVQDDGAGCTRWQVALDLAFTSVLRD